MPETDNGGPDSEGMTTASHFEFLFFVFFFLQMLIWPLIEIGGMEKKDNKEAKAVDCE